MKDGWIIRLNYKSLTQEGRGKKLIFLEFDLDVKKCAEFLIVFCSVLNMVDEFGGITYL